MKILIPLLGFGKAGGYRVLSMLANEWIKLGHEVTFIVPGDSEQPYFPTKAKIIWIDYTGKILENQNDISYTGSFGVAKRLLAIYKGLSNEEKYTDVILANHNLTAWPVAFIQTVAKKIYYVQAYEPEYYHQHSLKKYILKTGAYLSYYILSNKISNAPIYLKYKNLKSQDWVPPGIDFSLFYPSKSPEIIEEQFVMGCIGRKEIEKGIQHVIEAFLLLREKGIPVRLKVAYGNIPDEIRAREDVNVVVPQNDEELADFYRSLDVLVAPGLVQLGAAHYPVMEAMACGVPVVTTGYIPASSENAWIVPIADSHAIAKSIEEIMYADQDTIKIKTALSLKAIAEFGWENVSKKFITILMNINLKYS
jgi:glycosyltransferase involved in cell wall biosynthesis